MDFFNQAWLSWGIAVVPRSSRNANACFACFKAHQVKSEFLSHQKTQAVFRCHWNCFETYETSLVHPPVCSLLGQVQATKIKHCKCEHNRVCADDTLSVRHTHGCGKRSVGWPSSACTDGIFSAIAVTPEQAAVWRLRIFPYCPVFCRYAAYLSFHTLSTIWYHWLRRRKNVFVCCKNKSHKVHDSTVNLFDPTVDLRLIMNLFWTWEQYKVCLFFT